MSDPRTEGRRPRQTGSAPTLADVARIAGVSPMTVSRVINQEANVRALTRERVRTAIAKLNYVPNPAARSLAGSGHTRIALVYDNPSSGFLSEVLIGCLSDGRHDRVQLVVERLQSGEPRRDLIQRLLGTRVDGVILPPPCSDDAALVSTLAGAGLLVANLAGGDRSADAIALGVDDVAGARDMTQYLLELGHRRIGFIGGDRAQIASGRRQEGYRRALVDADIPFDPSLVANGDFTYRSGLAAADVLLALSERPTAIFASNDDMAAATVSVAHRHGLDVPRDLSVSGFDNTALAGTISPELTTIRQPIAMMAARAVTLLIEAVGHRRDTLQPVLTHEHLRHDLIRRGSTAAPAPTA